MRCPFCGNAEISRMNSARKALTATLNAANCWRTAQNSAPVRIDTHGAVVFLAGPGGRYITGQVLTVDGGMVM